MSKELFMSIDPGKAGFVALYADKTFSFISMPYHKVDTGQKTKTGKPKMKSVFNEMGLPAIVFQINQKYKDYKKYGLIEDVEGRGVWAAQNNFNFGHTAGLQEMIFLMLGIKPIKIKPQKWQSYVYRGYKKIMVPSSTGKTVIHDTKATSKMVAQDKAPLIDFRKTERAKELDDNKTDAFLMLLYLMEFELKKKDHIPFLKFKHKSF